MTTFLSMAQMFFWNIPIFFSRFPAALAGIVIVVAIITFITFLIFRKEKMVRLKASAEGEKIDKMLEDGKLSESEANELKRAVGAYSISKDEDHHLKITSILHITMSVGIAVSFFFILFMPFFTAPEKRTLIYGSIFVLVTFILLDVIAGVFLIKGKNWARFIIIGFSILMILFFPLGTVLGIYSLWVLLFRKNAEKYMHISENRRNTGLAVASMVLGILSFAGGWLFMSIPAVICGHITRSKIKDKGNGMALTGLVLGYTHIIVYLLALSCLYFDGPVVSKVISRRSGINNKKALGANVKTVTVLTFKKDGKEKSMKVCFPTKSSYTFREVKVGRGLTVIYTKKISSEKYSFKINYKINGKQVVTTAAIQSSELPKKVMNIDNWEVWAEKIAE